MPTRLRDDAEILENIGKILSPNCPIRAAQLRNLTLDEQIRFFLRTIDHDDFRSISMSRMQTLLNVFKVNTNAMFDYQPQPFQANNNVLFIRARDRDASMPSNIEQGWLDYLGAAHIQLHEVPGSHHSMMYPPFVAEVGKIVALYLNNT